MKEIILKARRQAAPSNARNASKKKIADFALKLVEEHAGQYDQITGVEFGGSYAKGTWLAKDADVDIFIKFKASTPEKEFVGISQKIGFEAMQDYGPYVRYSEHPYVEANIRETKVNVVPCYDVRRGRWKSAADRSPYHTKYIRDVFTARMRGEARLLKTFLRAADIYGAEIARQGFSGYVSEVLISSFGSFEKVVKAMADLKEGFVVGKARKKFDTPLVIVDPIDSKRNLAAAISEENVGRLVLRCRAFQKNPSMRFFKSAGRLRVDVDPKNILVVKFGFKPRSPETIWGQVKRAAASLATQLDVEEFNVLRSSSHTDEKRNAYLFFLLDSMKIPSVRVKDGPEFFRRDYADKFIEKNISQSKLMWVNQHRKIVSLETREFTDAVLFLRYLLENNQTCLPKGLRDDFKAGFRVFVGTSKLSESVKTAVRGLVSTDETFLHFD